MLSASDKDIASHRKVIIVDDDSDLLRLLVFAFESEGFETHGIEDGKKALSYLKDEKNTQSACLLVLDRLLPDMDGMEILKQLPDSFKKQIPVLILSVLSAERDVLVGLKQGAVDYIAKPFNLPILMGKALMLIGRHP